MPPNLEQQIRQSIAQWLEARADFYEGSRGEALAAYCDADRRLCAAFAADWEGKDPALLSRGYCAFQQMLTANLDRSPPGETRETETSECD
jgi:hypothetical protein